MPQLLICMFHCGCIFSTKFIPLFVYGRWCNFEPYAKLRYCWRVWKHFHDDPCLLFLCSLCILGYHITTSGLRRGLKTLPWLSPYISVSTVSSCLNLIGPSKSLKVEAFSLWNSSKGCHVVLVKLHIMSIFMFAKPIIQVMKDRM